MFAVLNTFRTSSVHFCGCVVSVNGPLGAYIEPLRAQYTQDKEIYNWPLHNVVSTHNIVIAVTENMW